MIALYELYNANTGKSYIGITGNLPNRIRQHIEYAKKGTVKLAAALRKHGIDSFVCKILGFYESRVLARVAEIAEIQKHDSYRCGYNGSPGGDGTDPEKIRGDKNVFHRPDIKARVLNAIRMRLGDIREQMVSNNPMQHPECRTKVAEAKRGKPRDQSTKDKMSHTRKTRHVARGENNPAAKLNACDVRYIRDYPRGFRKNIELSELYNVSVPLIEKIRCGAAWAHI